MSHKVSVSVLIPAYNAANFLPRAIETIRSQSAEPDEIIIVDDESTDDTAALGERLGARVLRRPHGGAAAARNAGLGIAKNEWIATLDADDLWHPAKLRMQLDVVSAEPRLGLVFTDFDAVSELDGQLDRPSIVSNNANFERIKRTPLTPQADLLDFADFLYELAARPVIQPSTAIFRRDLALAIGGFPTNVRAEDSDFFLRLAARTETAFVNVPLAAYIGHPSQVSANRDLDAVRLELHHHVMTHQSNYHDLILTAFKKEYARALYYGAAHAASKKRFPTALRLFIKAVAAASISGQLTTLVRLGLQSRLLGAQLRRPQREPLRQELPFGNATVRDVEIPWRRSSVHHC
jgi:glycosyltransferase involved in cell wall biosynthesis